ncbi:hypothetical protein [Diaphorobacter aerolatus]|nr:hypothetical protein [Diaphorobacter aerolatus]
MPTDAATISPVKAADLPAPSAEADLQAVQTLLRRCLDEALERLYPSLKN